MTFLVSNDFPGLFQAWKTVLQNSMTFQLFHDPQEPCLYLYRVKKYHVHRNRIHCNSLSTTINQKLAFPWTKSVQQAGYFTSNT
jgi:hypothetical protein